MNGRIIKFEGSVHAQADRLLPWYVNGTLAEDERLHVEQHLLDCAQCQREVTWLRGVQEEFAAQAEKDDVSPPMQHLHRRVRARRRTKPFSSPWHRREKQLAWLAAVQAVVIVAMSATLFHQQHAAYRTLSAPSEKGAWLVVVFDPHTREAQMRQLLRDSDARIVGGPTEGGGYVLRVPDAHEAAVRKLLLGSPQVTLVEDLGAGDHP